MHPIDAQAVSKEFRTRFGRNRVLALDEVTLTIQPGEVFGLLGPNGAGKTTFIKLLLTLIFPTGGSTRLFGAEPGDPLVKKRIGYLPENHRFPGYLTGGDFLDLFGRLSGMSSSALPSRIDEVLHLVEMTKWKKTKLRQYSKGMLQRIGLAQALIHDPDLVILDEPTDGVDPVGRKQIRDILLSLKQRGKTVFLNSHLLSEVEHVCDRVAILNKGKLVRLGSVSELTESRDRFTIQFEGSVPESLLRTWEATRARITVEASRLSLTADSLSEVNAVLDQLRAAGLLIEDLSRTRQSLEDLFITVVSEEEAP